MNGIFVSVKSMWFTKYVGDKVGLIYERYTAEVTEDIGAVKLLKSSV